MLVNVVPKSMPTGVTSHAAVAQIASSHRKPLSRQPFATASASRRLGPIANDSRLRLWSARGQTEFRSWVVWAHVAEAGNPCLDRVAASSPSSNRYTVIRLLTVQAMASSVAECRMSAAIRLDQTVLEVVGMTVHP